MPRRPKLGQHFLVSESTARRIAELVPQGAAVVEIGPGHGALTGFVLERAKEYVGVELDAWLADRLEKRYGNLDNFRLVGADFLRFEPPPELGDGLALVGNIPYAVSSKIVQRASAEPRYRRAALMFQLEFAERLTAGVDDGSYGSLSVYTAYHWETRIAIRVSRKKFRPEPRVDSAVVEFKRHSGPPVDVSEPGAMFALVRACFTRRRKQLGNAAVGGLGIERDVWLAALEAAGIERTRRAQELNLEDFARLYGRLEEARFGSR